MKTAISIPDDVYARAERFARRERRSRSEVYSTAVREYVARHEPEVVTDALNDVIADVSPAVDPFVVAASRQVLVQSEW
jgi:metal-responsive CopG/Arc/MetJ family transcriptional regulator